MSGDLPPLSNTNTNTKPRHPYPTCPDRPPDTHTHEPHPDATTILRGDAMNTYYEVLSLLGPPTLFEAAYGFRTISLLHTALTQSITYAPSTTSTDPPQFTSPLTQPPIETRTLGRLVFYTFNSSNRVSPRPRAFCPVSLGGWIHTPTLGTVDPDRPLPPSHPRASSDSRPHGTPSIDDQWRERCLIRDGSVATKAIHMCRTEFLRELRHGVVREAHRRTHERRR